MIPHWQNHDINDIEGEVWKPVKGYVDRYFASNLGRIKTLFYKQKYPKILKQTINEDGYLEIGARSDRGKAQKRRLAHRFVGLSFHDNPENKPEINHLDFNKLNNFEWNIVWATGLENRLHPLEAGITKMYEIIAFNAHEKLKFESLNSCAKHFNYDIGKLYSRINRNKMYDGFFFCCDQIKDRPLLIKPGCKPVTATNHIETLTFKSISEAAEYFKREKKNFKTRIGKNKLFDGYFFTYTNT